MTYGTSVAREGPGGHDRSIGRARQVVRGALAWRVDGINKHFSVCVVVAWQMFCMLRRSRFRFSSAAVFLPSFLYTRSTCGIAFKNFVKFSFAFV